MHAFDPTDFSMLQSQKWHARIRAAASAAGLTLPYFRSHDVRAGAETEIDGRRLMNFSSYDYLGLNGRPAVRTAAIAAIEQFGTSVSASRLVAGERPFHAELERELAAVYGVDEALTFVSGHATNVTVVGHLLGAPDLLVHDASIHNSVVMGGRQSGAKLLKFSHNDLDQLEALLTAERGAYRRCLIAVEGLYSMEGDLPNLTRLVEIKNRHRAWLMVDEAHALGVIGSNGLGSAEHHGVRGRDVDVWMGTLSKTLASAGGYVAGSSLLIDYLKHSAPGFVFSVGLSAPAAAAALAALRILRQEPELPTVLGERSRALKNGAQSLGLDTGTSVGAAIVPLYMGDNVRTLIWSESLFEAGVNVLPILFPAVAYDGGLLRFFVSSEHSPDHITRTVDLAGQTFARAMGAEVGARGSFAATKPSAP
jgi:8-amino-7-oxononanoate synthase